MFARLVRAAEAVDVSANSMKVNKTIIVSSNPEKINNYYISVAKVKNENHKDMINIVIFGDHPSIHSDDIWIKVFDKKGNIIATKPLFTNRYLPVVTTGGGAGSANAFFEIENAKIEDVVKVEIRLFPKKTVAEFK